MLIIIFSADYRFHNVPSTCVITIYRIIIEWLPITKVRHSNALFCRHAASNWINCEVHWIDEQRTTNGPRHVRFTCVIGRAIVREVLPFRTLIRSKSSERAAAMRGNARWSRRRYMCRYAKSPIQRGPGAQLFEFTVVILQSRSGLCRANLGSIHSRGPNVGRA